MKTKNLPTYSQCVEADEAGCANNLMSFIRINTPDESEEYGEGMFRDDLMAVINEAEDNAASKILQHLSVIFTDYKNAGYNVSAQITRYIMTQIEKRVKS